MKNYKLFREYFFKNRRPGNPTRDRKIDLGRLRKSNFVIFGHRIRQLPLGIRIIDSFKPANLILRTRPRFKQFRHL